jgi:hypothetical protein
VQKVVSLHDPDDVVGQFYLCFFHPWAALYGGPCIKKAKVKLDNRIVKIVLSNPEKLVKGKGKGILKIEGYVSQPYVVLVSSTFWNFLGAAWACAA